MADLAGGDGTVDQGSGGSGGSGGGSGVSSPFGSVRRNRIVNPAMQITQENGNTAGTTNAFYVADQWSMEKVHSAGTMTAQRVQSVTPNGSKDRFRITITSADASLAAGEFLVFQQRIEGLAIADFGYGLSSAEQTILRFGFKGPAGTYAVSLRNSALDRSYIALFTITGGQANTDTEQIIVIPGDTTGTWLSDTGVGIRLMITLACGSTYQGAAGWQAGSIFGTSAVSNGMGTGGAVFELFDVGLYLDPLLTGIPPRWELPDYAEELLACQRYFEGVTGVYHANVWGAAYYKATKRVVPSITFSVAPAGGSGVTDIMIWASHNATVTYSFWANARM